MKKKNWGKRRIILENCYRLFFFGRIAWMYHSIKLACRVVQSNSLPNLLALIQPKKARFRQAKTHMMTVSMWCAYFRRVTVIQDREFLDMRIDHPLTQNRYLLHWKEQRATTKKWKDNQTNITSSGNELTLELKNYGEMTFFWQFRVKYIFVCLLGLFAPLNLHSYARYSWSFPFEGFQVFPMISSSGHDIHSQT